MFSLTARKKRGRLLLHIGAVLALVAPAVLVYFQVSLKLQRMTDGIVRAVVSAPEMRLVAAAQGKLAEVAAWERAHPAPDSEPWLLRVPNLLPLGVLAATVVEVTAWRRRKAS